MLQRAKRLEHEYQIKVRSVDIKHAAPVHTLEHVITFSELRSLDLLCRDALSRALPEANIADKWYVNERKGFSGPQDIVDEFSAKRIQLQHAIAMIEAAQVAPSSSSKIVPAGYSKLSEPIRLFWEDAHRHSDQYDRNVFIMTRFEPGNEHLEMIDDVIRQTLTSYNLHGHRADDRCYPSDRNLWDNVCVYMICCKYGIAVLENIIYDEFNPNVALEYGFMRALAKPTLLLKEARLKPRADILGTLWETFDILNIKKTVSKAVSKWVKDLGLPAAQTPDGNSSS